MIEYAQFYWADWAMIIVLFIAEGLLIWKITKGKHPAQNATVEALAKMRAERDQLIIGFDREVEINANLRAALHEAALMRRKAEEHRKYAEDYENRATLVLEDAAFIQKEEKG